MAMNQIDFGAIAKRNKANVDAVPDGGTLSYVATLLSSGHIVLIGANHDPSVVEFTRPPKVKVTGTTDPSKGFITVTKGSGRDPGTLTVTGLRSGQREFEHQIAKFSNKKVVYA